MAGVGFRKCGITDNGYRVYFRRNKNVLKLEVVMAAQLCEYTKHYTEHFKYENYAVCKLYLNKIV